MTTETSPATEYQVKDFVGKEVAYPSSSTEMFYGEVPELLPGAMFRLEPTMTLGLYVVTGVVVKFASMSLPIETPTRDNDVNDTKLFCNDDPVIEAFTGGYIKTTAEYVRMHSAIYLYPTWHHVIANVAMDPTTRGIRTQYVPYRDVVNSAVFIKPDLIDPSPREEEVKASDLEVGMRIEMIRQGAVVTQIVVGVMPTPRDQIRVWMI